MNHTISRRRFVALASFCGFAGVGGAGTLRGSRAQTMPVRRDAHSIDPDSEEGRRLRLAFAILQQNDLVSAQIVFHPAGLTQLARYHAQICGPNGVRTVVRAGDPSLRAFFDNEVHFSWWFLPWHRAYLAAVEHLLRDLTATPELALPYWDWYRNPDIPPLFREDAFFNPLADTTRRVGLFAPTPTGSPDLPPEQHREGFVVAPLTFGEFGGGQLVPVTVGDTERVQLRPGRLETMPHNAGHVFVAGHMQDFTTAGLDPIFFAHHANVDRLWEVWKATLPAGSPPAPQDPSWAAREFTFQNASGGALLMASGDTADPGSLSFRQYGTFGETTEDVSYVYDRTSLSAEDQQLVDQLRGLPGPAPSDGVVAATASEPVLALRSDARVLSEKPITFAAPGATGAELTTGTATPSRALVRLVGMSAPTRHARLKVIARSADGSTTLLAEHYLIPFLTSELAALAETALTIEMPSAAASSALSGDNGRVEVVLEGLLGDEVKLPLREAELLLF